MAVLTSQTNGWSFDTLLEMTLVPHGEVLKIRRIAERNLGRIADPEIQITSWGSLKSLFYSEPPTP